MMEPAPLPTVSIVMPVLNQARFVEAAIRSVLDQNYSALEFGIVDGGSTDGTLEIVTRYADRLAFVISEPDNGQYAALNKGFARTSGQIMAWLNADDLYTGWALSVVGELFSRFDEIEWLTTLYPLVWDEQGRAVACFHARGFSPRGFLKGDNLPRPGAPSRRWIQQESTFWRRSLWHKAGGTLDESLTLASDFDLWARFFRFAALHGVETPLAGFRSHGHQRSLEHQDAYRAEALRVLKNYRGAPRGVFAELVASRLVEPLPRRVWRWLYNARLAPGRPVCRYLGPEQGWVVEPC